MIAVSLSTEGGSFRAKAFGHANTAPFGQDIVCAAVSVLVCSFAAVLYDAEETGKLISLDIRLEHGDAEIFCKPKPAHRKEVAAWLRYFEAGMDALAERYPEAVLVN